jgi:ectoine hydroxylase-related dioxygenase (phytanoyl-CoA dioxygenase family)
MILIKRLLFLVAIFLSPLILILGIIYYLIKRSNKEFYFQSFIKVYCLSFGVSNMLMSKFISFSQTNFFKKKNLIASELQRGGYYIFDEILEEKKLENLINITKTLSCKKNEHNDVKNIFYDNVNPYKLIYAYNSEDLICKKEVLEIVADEKYKNIARNYFNAEPFLVSVNMWWTTNYSTEASSEAAQKYHFDLERIKFLKFFIYLTDVEIDNGPHVYIEGSHKVFSKPFKFLKKFYSRIDDYEIEKYYGKNKIKTVIGKSGTTIVGDTSCFHKGTPVKKKSRLIFEFELANSLFGAKDYLNSEIINNNLTFLEYSKKDKNYFYKYF